MPHLLSDLNFPTLRKDIYHIWHSHHNPRLQRYSQASNSNPPRDLDSHGFTSQGTVVPGILHVGRLLGVAAFQGLPAPRPAHYSEDVGYMQLTTAADIIVSVLYMRHPGLLRRFLDVLPDQEFTYMHSMEERAESIEWFGRLEERPFVIVRNGNMVEAGFHETVVVNNEISVCWHSVVKYTIQLSGVWVQEFSKSCRSVPPGFFGPTQEKESLGRIEGPYERKKFERNALEILTPAITQRRWMELSGFCIKVLFLPLAQSCPSIWESSLREEGWVESGEKSSQNGRKQYESNKTESIED